MLAVILRGRNMDNIIGSVEKYLREFILYLTTFFFGTKVSADPRTEEANKTAIFCVISAIAGAYLWNRYIFGDAGTLKDVTGLVVDRLMLWFTLGSVLTGLLTLARIKTDYLFTTLEVMRVFSVSHIVAIYMAYVLYSVFWFFHPLTAISWAAHASYLIEFVMIAIYLPKGIFSLYRNEHRKVALSAVCAATLLLVGIILITPLAMVNVCPAVIDAPESPNDKRETLELCKYYIDLDKWGAK